MLLLSACLHMLPPYCQNQESLKEFTEVVEKESATCKYMAIHALLYPITVSQFNL